MTTKKRAKPENLQKLTALFEQYPDGLNMRQIQTELQTSAVLAQAALDELGAVKDGAKWVLADDEPAPVEVVEAAPGAKAEIEPKQLDQSVFDGLPPEYRWAGGRVKHCAFFAWCYLTVI